VQPRPPPHPCSPPPPPCEEDEARRVRRAARRQAREAAARALAAARGDAGGASSAPPPPPPSSDYSYPHLATGFERAATAAAELQQRLRGAALEQAQVRACARGVRAPQPAAGADAAPVRSASGSCVRRTCARRRAWPARHGGAPRRRSAMPRARASPQLQLQKRSPQPSGASCARWAPRRASTPAPRMRSWPPRWRRRRWAPLRATRCCAAASTSAAQQRAEPR
jgi:hypothetical protein